MTMTHRFSFLAFLLAGALAAAARTQDPLTQRPYQEWTAAEAQKLLTDSPWAQAREKGVELGAGNLLLTEGGIPNRPEVVIMRLRSALPIRQALARLRQIKAKYDKLADSDKKAFDEKNKPLLDCPACESNYVVALGPGELRGKGVPSVFTNIPEAEIKANVHIANDLGETRQLVHFERPKYQGDEAVFFFARFDEKDRPLLSPGNKKLIVVFDPKIFSTSPAPIHTFEFDVAKMIVNGQVAF